MQHARHLELLHKENSRRETVCERRGKRDTRRAHRNHHYEKEVSGDIEDRGDDEGHQRRIRIAFAAEDGCEEVVDGDEGQPQKEHPQIVRCMFRYRIRYGKEGHDFAAEDFTDRCDHESQDQGKRKRGMNPAVGGCFILHADETGDDDVGAQGEPHRKTHDGTDHRNVGPHCRHGFV